MISPRDFVDRWSRATLREQQAAQSHFNELCQLVGHKTPTERDPEGTFFTFEEHVEKATGGAGRADVWLKGHFAWEYKGKLRDLDAAYNQLLAYRGSLDNPPLLVVCDFLEYRIYPQFPNLSGQPIKFTNADLLDERTRDFIRWLLTDPNQFKHYLEQQRTASEALTEKLALEFAELARLMREHPTKAAPKWQPMQIARFLTKLVFALFAEDVGLMPVLPGSPVFRFLVEGARVSQEGFVDELRRLFEAMNGKTSHYITIPVPYFDGALFDESAPGAGDGLEVLDLTEIPGALDLLEKASDRDWRKVDPTIFGSLFEGALDESKRAQLGAHYTKETDIRLVIDPVLMAPLLREWDAVRAEAEPLLRTLLESPSPAEQMRAESRLRALRDGMLNHLESTRVLDPACGSGNFLYVSLKAMKDLEKQVRDTFRALDPDAFRDVVTPRQFFGIEKDSFAARLAHVVLWIGYLQWRYEDEGILHWRQPKKQPHPHALPSPIIQDRLHPDDPPRITNDDAILRYRDDGTPYEPEWPPAEIIIGNPPFLGSNSMRAELGIGYTETLRRLYEGRVPGGADLVTYWFERARARIEAGQSKRAGLITTQSIRAGANRSVLERIKGSGDIFLAWSDNKWSLAGASVRISIIGFDNGSEMERTLDGQIVSSINSDLSSALDLTTAHQLIANRGLTFQGPVKVGDFDISDVKARNLLGATNPSGVSNQEVIKPWLNGEDITSRPRNMWIIDFGEMALEQAELYLEPIEHIRTQVKPSRDSNNRARRRNYWWHHGETVPGLRGAILHLKRYIATPRVAKHRLFVWVNTITLPDSRIYAIARDDDYFFGVLHSYTHELWSIRQASRHGVGNDPTYNNTTCFETFPFPFPPGQEPGRPASLYGTSNSPLQHGEGQGVRSQGGEVGVRSIAAAAAALHAERDAWLNPPDLLALDLSGDSKEIKERTLTNLYNAVAAARGSTEKLGKLVEAARRFAPRMIELHDALDAAVLAAYGWSDLAGRLRTPAGDEDLLARLLAENQRRAGERENLTP